MRLVVVAVVALGAAAIGCNTIDPNPKMQSVMKAIDAAKSAGAESVPAANDLLAQATKYLGLAQTQAKGGALQDAMRSLGLAGAAADDAKVTATESASRAKADALSQQIADLKTKLGKQ